MKKFDQNLCWHFEIFNFVCSLLSVIGFQLYDRRISYVDIYVGLMTHFVKTLYCCLKCYWSLNFMEISWKLSNCFFFSKNL